MSTVHGCNIKTAWLFYGFPLTPQNSSITGRNGFGAVTNPGGGEAADNP